MARLDRVPPLDKTDSFEKLDKFNSMDPHFRMEPLSRLGQQMSVPEVGGRSRRKSSHVVPSSTRQRTAAPPRRKFSDVVATPRRKFSDAVARKLSSTIGWRTQASLQEVVHQAKCLCSQYIRARLKRSGAFHRRLGLQRLSSLASLHGGPEMCQVFREMALIGVELERMYPALYASISRQINLAITSDKTVRAVLNSVASQLFRTDVTWGKIISLYAVAGGLAVECVKLGHPEYLAVLIDSVGLVTEGDIGHWIATQGGWGALLTRFRPPNTEPSIGGVLITGGAGLLAVAVFLMFLLRALSRMVTNLRESVAIGV